MDLYHKFLGMVRGTLLDQLLVTGADLLSEHGENPEYDRAIYELIANSCRLSLPESVQDDGEAAMNYVRHRIAIIKAGA